MSESKRFELDRVGIFDNKTNHFYYKTFDNEEVVDLLNYQDRIIEEQHDEIINSTKKYVEIQKECGEQQEQLDVYKEAILTMLGVLADKGIIFSGVKDE